MPNVPVVFIRTNLVCLAFTDSPIAIAHGLYSPTDLSQVLLKFSRSSRYGPRVFPQLELKRQFYNLKRDRDKTIGANWKKAFVEYVEEFVSVVFVLSLLCTPTHGIMNLQIAQKFLQRREEGTLCITASLRAKYVLVLAHRNSTAAKTDYLQVPRCPSPDPRGQRPSASSTVRDCLQTEAGSRPGYDQNTGRPKPSISLYLSSLPRPLTWSSGDQGP